MKHFHLILLLTAFLFVSPVVYAGLKLKESATPVETQIVSAPAPTSIQPLIIESTLGQPKKSILNTSQAEITSSSITSSSKADSSSQSATSSQVSSSSSTNSSSIAPKLNSLITVGITPINVSSIPKTEKTEKQPTKTQSSILAQKTQSSDQLLQPTETTITETKTIVEEIKVDPIPASSVISSNNSNISNSSKNTFPPVSMVESEKAIEPKTSPKIESKPEVKAQSSVSTQAESKPTTYNGLIDYYCGQYGCNPVQLKRVMMCESTNNPNARNGIYSGLFQFSPATFRNYSTKMGLVNANIWDAEDQINVASWMFANGQARQWSCK